ncbi:hypothetical protein ACF0H5_001602 [Mactra antiquata]
MAMFNPGSSLDVNEESSGLCCAICLDQYEDPRSLACMHTFCERCVYDFVMKQVKMGVLLKGIECPLCRKVTVIRNKEIPPEQWSKTVPNNYALLDVLEALKADVKAKQSVDMCETHNKDIEFYCEEEHTLCCSICAVNKVKEGKEIHEIGEIAWEKNRTLTEPLQRQIHDLTLKANNVKVFLNDTEEDLEVRVDNLQIEMNSLQDRMVEKMEQAREELVSELTVLGRGHISKLQAQRSRCSALIAVLEEATYSLNLAIQYKTPSQLFIELYKMQAKINELQTDIEEQTTMSKDSDITFAPSEAVNDFLEKDLRIGNLKLEEKPVNVENMKDYRKLRFRLKSCIDVEPSTADVKQALFSGMKFMSNGDLIAVDNANWNCVVLSKQLKYKGSLQFSTHVFDVVEASNGVIYVTGAKRLERVVVDNIGGLTPAGTITVESCPFSISVLDEEQFVVGTYRTQTPVRIISRAGSESDWNIEFPQKHWKIDSSRCVYNKQTKVLVLSDRYENCVYIYDTQIGHEVRVKNDNIVEPRGVAFGPHGCVFVCSKGTNAIVQLSRYGEMIGNYYLDIIYPCTLCFSNDNKYLAVSNSYANDKKMVILEVIQT